MTNEPPAGFGGVPWVSIPELKGNAIVKDRKNAPGWFQPENSAGEKLKPVIRCNCGKLCGIGLHHVHASGYITRSFFEQSGCGWHVWLKLEGYTGGDFPPEP